MAVAGFGLNALGGKQESKAAKQLGADLITIDTLKQFGDLEYPVVRFEHDKHTKAVEGKCESCHTVTGNTVKAKFKREEDTTAAEMKAIYHDNCIACHEDTAKAGKKSGPESGQCRTCHAGPAETSRTLISFDKSLHYRHQSSKMVPAPAGQEENCSKCHTQDKPEKRDLSFAEGKEQAHEKCMSCHMEIAKAKQPSGPVECAGCHDAAVRAEFKQVADVPRLEAGQTDFMLLMGEPVETEGSAAKPVLVNAVPFNHKLHEDKNENCSVCHHTASAKGVVACSQCHTSLGKEEGGFVTTEQAMHSVTSKASCVGCHAQAQEKKQCAGCHTFMGRTGQKTDTSCAKCHVSISAGPGLLQDKTAKANTAAMLMNVRVKADTEIKVDEIPEIVEIGVLSNEYEPSKFPHRKIVQKIMDGMKDDAMAAYFHSSPGAVCSGCHHNSPASANPPKCVSCHGKNAGPMSEAKPDLKTAYHQQCIGCHTEMGIEKPAATACAECHAVKK
jgi:mono/diheme cytochrome c family protein